MVSVAVEVPHAPVGELRSEDCHYALREGLGADQLVRSGRAHVAERVSYVDQRDSFPRPCGFVRRSAGKQATADDGGQTSLFTGSLEDYVDFFPAIARFRWRRSPEDFRRLPEATITGQVINLP